jgi:hypothetical protein
MTAQRYIYTEETNFTRGLVMGYFSNGIEGDRYEETYCINCVHYANFDVEKEECAVLEAHLLYNYDECNNPKSILDVLIPRGKYENEKCRMFFPLHTR